jgi:hypothetical protein
VPWVLRVLRAHRRGTAAGGNSRRIPNRFHHSAQARNHKPRREERRSHKEQTLQPQTLTDMARATSLRPAFLSPYAPCPISNQSLLSYDSDPEVPAPSGLALTHFISPAPHYNPSIAPPDAHRRLKLNLRCGSGEVLERIARGWGGLVSQKTCLLASAEPIRPRFAGGRVRLWFPPEVTTPLSRLRPYVGTRFGSLCKRYSPEGAAVSDRNGLSF